MNDSFVYNHDVKGRRGYVICANPRSGSTFLIYLLRSTKVLGVPYEWIRADGAPAHPDFESYTQDADTQISYVLHQGTTANGVYALKMFPEHFDRQGASRWTERLPDLRYVLLLRRDILGQAISLTVARQTSSWAEWMSEVRTPVYDRDGIWQNLRFIVAGEARWRLFFAANGIVPLELFYEDVVCNPQAAIDRIASLVDVVEATGDAAAFTPSIQRGNRSAEWRSRYLREEGDLTRLPQLADLT